jgi:NRPS condensation-like uncharacterized protein
MRSIVVNFYEYCESKKLDISNLSESSVVSLADCYLENIEITLTDIKALEKIDTGVISLSDSLAETIKKAKSYGIKNNNDYGLNISA